jgi:hypothetical protein
MDKYHAGIAYRWSRGMANENKLKMEYGNPGPVNYSASTTQQNLSRVDGENSFNLRSYDQNNCAGNTG